MYFLAIIIAVQQNNMVSNKIITRMSFEISTVAQSFDCHLIILLSAYDMQ